MMHRSYMRRGVSLEVIVEEDDNAEVSLDPILFQDESDSSPSSPTLSVENEMEKSSKETDEEQNCNDTDDHSDKLRQEREKRRKQKQEEKWRSLERQRSLSCETLTILDVGDDEFSKEQWEVETRDWDSENPSTSSEIEQSISRRKILASRLEYQDKYDEDYHAGTRDKYDQDYPEETRVDNEADEVEMENGRCWNPNKAEEGSERDSEILSQYTQMESIKEDKEEMNGLKEEEEDEEEESFYDQKSKENELLKKDNDGNDQDCDIEINQNFHTFPEEDNSYEGSTPDTELSISNSRSQPQTSWSRDPFSNGEDSWITVGDLDDGTEDEHDDKDHDINHTLPTTSIPTTIPTNDNLTNIFDEIGNSQTFDEISNSPKTKHKEVRFSDQLEFVTEQLEEGHELQPLNKVNFENEHFSNDKIEIPKLLTSSDTNSEVLLDNLVSVKAGKHLFEGKSFGRTSSPIAERLTAVLETPDIMIVEKTDDSRDEEVDTAEQNPDSEVSQGTISPTYNVHNVELHPEELPPPHTVASVRQLFEKLPTFTVRNVRQYNLLNRYDHVRSNPTSKILRFDRHEQSNSTKPIEKASTPPPVAANLLQSRGIKFTPEMIQSIQKKNQPLRPAEDYSSTGVHLRKPKLAHGFDVLKALRENPRYFHIRVGEKGKKEDNRVSNSINSNPKGKRNTIKYSYLEAKHQRHSGNTTSLRWAKESVDRSDSESMSSESSEDSGVSRDFTSSILSSFSSSSKKKKPKWRDPNLLQEEYGSDPSFKWIDPTVLAKIRARGTTVIYFGPRHRPQGNVPNRASRRTFQENLPLFEDITKESPTLKNIVNNFDNDNAEDLRRHNAQYNKDDFLHSYTPTSTDIANARPKIVGVTHKKNPNSSGEMDAISSKTCNSKNQFKPKPFLHMDSRLLHMKELKKKSDGGNSIIYDFTEKQT